MIDLHIHTTYSDGSENCETILKKSQEKNLDYISITDHNTALAYEELKNKEIRDLFSGKIISGIELNTKVLGVPIEILGYGINYKKINKMVEDVYIPATKRNIIEVERLYKKCINYGIKIDKNCLNRYSSNIFASVFFHNEIIKNKENHKLISEEAWKSSKIFYREYMSNPRTPLYVEMDDFVPDFKIASDLIRQSGGFVFIPHIYEYKDNSKVILDYILKNYNIDGIECYYTTFSDKQHIEIIDMCKSYNLFISGGSDFHGKYKPDVDIGVGYGNLKIPTSILDNWINKIQTF